MKRYKLGMVILSVIVLTLVGISGFALGEELNRGQIIVDPDIYVDIYKPDKTWTGTTLLPDYHNLEKPRIIEVNMRGEIIWQYLLPKNLRKYVNPGFDAELLPNNDILFLLPGNGVYEINRNGNIVWSYLDEKVSHDADRLPNGNTLVIWGGGDKISDAQVKEINPKGEIIWAWYAKDHFYKSPFKEISRDGWTHANAVVRLPNGNTLINLRNFHLTVEVNTQGSVVQSFSWKELGKRQHDPEVLPNGNMLAGLREPHRAVEVDPKTGEIVWQYATPPLRTIRDADRLPNGNTLIVERISIIEVTPEGEIVWRLNVKGLDRDKKEDKEKCFYKAQRID